MRPRRLHLRLSVHSQWFLLYTPRHSGQGCRNSGAPARQQSRTDTLCRPRYPPAAARYHRFRRSSSPKRPVPPSAPALSSGCLPGRSFRSIDPALRRAARGTPRERSARRNTQIPGTRFPSVSTISRRPMCHFAKSPEAPAAASAHPKPSHRNTRVHRAGRLFRLRTAGFCFLPALRVRAARYTVHSGTGCTPRGSGR